MRGKWLWAVLALVAVLGITTAANATVRGLITGTQIARHTINSKHLVNHTIQTHDLSSAAVNSLRGAKGDTGAMGPQGPKGDTGATGAAGSARAYGLIWADGLFGLNAKNVAAVTNPEAGRFCITFTPAAGIDPSLTGLVVTPYNWPDGTRTGANQPQAFAEWGGTCAGSGGAEGLEVLTWMRSVSRGSVGGLGTGTFVTGVYNTMVNQPFFFVVP